MENHDLSNVTALGAGNVGLCTALSLEKAGIPVRVIDAFEPGGPVSVPPHISLAITLGFPLS